MDDGFGVGGRLEDRAFRDQFVAQQPRIGEVSVVRDREAAAREVGEHRLYVAHHRAARRRIADVADGVPALQLGDVPVIAEDVTDQTHMAFGGELRTVKGDDAGRLLAAMLKRVQAERRQGRGVVVAEDAEDPAFLMQFVVEWRRHREELWLLPVASNNLSSAPRSSAP